MVNMKELTTYINEEKQTTAAGAEKLIQQIIDDMKGCDEEARKSTMAFVRDYLNTIGKYEASRLEKKFNISKAYPDSITNVAQWVLAKISKK